MPKCKDPEREKRAEYVVQRKDAENEARAQAIIIRNAVQRGLMSKAEYRRMIEDDTDALFGPR